MFAVVTQASDGKAFAIPDHAVVNVQELGGGCRLVCSDPDNGQYNLDVIEPVQYVVDQFNGDA